MSMSMSSARVVVAAAALLLVGAACGSASDPPGEPEAARSPVTTPMSEPDGAEMPMTDASPDGEMMTGHDEMMTEHDAPMGTGDIGEPASAGEATRTIEVTVDNTFDFRPDRYEVAAGDVVTFEVTNIGDIEHEFVLGDEAMQQQMAESMSEGHDHAHSGDVTNAVTVHGGETELLTWRFGGPGEVLVGCHLPGHYAAGMQGVVVVS